MMGFQGPSAPAGGDAPHTGTTIMAVAYEGGVVLGADSRVSTGTYVSNRASNKIAELTDKVTTRRLPAPRGLLAPPGPAAAPAPPSRACSPERDSPAHLLR